MCEGVVTPSPFYTQMEGVGGCPGVTSQSSERKLGVLGHLAALVPVPIIKMGGSERDTQSSAGPWPSRKDK